MSTVRTGRPARREAPGHFVKLKALIGFIFLHQTLHRSIMCKASKLNFARADVLSGFDKPSEKRGPGALSAPRPLHAKRGFGRVFDRLLTKAMQFPGSSKDAADEIAENEITMIETMRGVAIEEIIPNDHAETLASAVFIQPEQMLAKQRELVAP